MNESFFLQPNNDRQKRYEALRVSHVEKLPDEIVAEKFGYTYYSFKSLKRDLRYATADDFFLPLTKGKRQTAKTIQSKDLVIELRKRNYSVVEIKEKLQTDHNIVLSESAINYLLQQEGFTRIYRRTFREKMEILQQKQQYPEKSDAELFAFHSDVNTAFGGVFLFLPIIMELGFDKLFPLDFYGSKSIPPINYLMSYLCVKLLGSERLSHAGDYSFDFGLGYFSGLNTLPKSSTLSCYSYRHSSESIKRMLVGFTKLLYKNGYLKGKNINLDFHSIPYFGQTQEIEKNWVATRGKRMQSILSFFAQDLDTTCLCYSNADIKNGEQNDEVLEFLKFYKKSTGMLPERLIFDSKLTTYQNLDQINKQGVKFITLGRRGTNFLKNIQAISTWKKIELDNLKRKYRSLEYYASNIKLNDYDGELLQVYVKGNGRELPMRLLTNDFDSTIKSIVTLYAHRWRIENNIGENVDFFNLNGLQSPVVVQVNFDIAITLVANTLYKILAKKLRWFENQQPKTLSRKFLNMQTNIKSDQQSVTLRFQKDAYVPIVKDWIDTLEPIKIPWWENRQLNFVFA